METYTKTDIFWHNLVYAATRFKRSKDIKTDPDRKSRRHWRPSLKKCILATWQPPPDNRMPDSYISGLSQELTEEAHFVSAYLQLPVELIDIIEDFLSPTDIACLRQTCCALQNINRAYRCPPVRDLSPLQLFSLRRRLDRDSFPVLCQLETSNQLPHKLVACSACLTLHKRKFFEDEQLFETPAQTRVCKASRYVFEVAGQSRDSASTLH